MSLQDTLMKFLRLFAPALDASKAGVDITSEGAWNSSLLMELREKLVAELTQSGTIEQLDEASQQLRKQHADLLAKPESTPDYLKKLGALSEAAYVLSSKALQSAATPQAIFLYTIKQLIPWLQRAVEAGILIAAVV